MAHAPIWKSRPVFITSTFQDMQAERDHLRNQVFPALEEWLKRKRRHLEWIDLRVGVASAKAEDEVARELLVLKVCLDEVKRSRPFLIALIGDRYGWVPPKERIKAAATEAGFSAEVEDRSVTDLEIDFGVFHDKAQQRRSLFFLRAPLPYDKMRSEKAAEYSDDYAKDEDAAKRWERLKALKTRIRTEYADRCFDYTANWDEKRECVSGLEAWGRDVEGKIKQAIEDELAAEPQSATEQTPDDIERDALADFAEDRARDFIGRKKTLAEIEALFKSPTEEGAPWGLCITGEAGTGKSALFSALYQGLTRVKKDETERVSGEQRDLYERLGKLDILVLAHAAGASPRATSVDVMLRRWIGELASFLNEAPGLEEKAGPNDVEAKFSSLLGRAALQRRVIVLVDALDQFEQTSQGRFVTWLPRLWPENARFIATAIPGDASEALSKRPGITHRPIPALDADEARNIATAISARYHRELEAQVLDALIGDDKRWSNPLWLVLAVEELNLLDADDFARARHDFEELARDDERIRALMCQMATGFPADVPGLYRRSFDHAAELFGTKLTQAFLGLIAASRAGWRESDFREVLPMVSGEAWDELRFAQLRRSFRGQMRRRGGMEQWDFSHAQMRIAAKDWLIETKGPAEVSFHTALGDHLLALSPDDQLHVSETMLHLMEGEDWEIRAANYCGSMLLTAEEAAGATGVLAERVLTAEENNVTTEYLCVDALLNASGLANDVRGVLADRILFDLSDRIAPQAWQDTLGKLAQSAAETLVQLTNQDPGNALWQRDLSVSYFKIGDVLVKQGNLPEVLKSYRDGLAIAERLAQSDSGNAGWQRDLSVSYLKIGDVLVVQGNLPEALKSYRDGYAIRERLARGNSGNALWQHDLSESWDKIGNVLKVQGNLPEALKSYRDGLAIAERLARGDPGNALWQRDLSVSWLKIGDVLVAQGNLPEALKSFRDGLAIAERLARGDPGNAGWQRDLSASYDRIGDVLKAQGNLPEALKSHRDGIAIRERLARGDPGNAGWQRDLSVSWNNTGDVLVAQGHLPEALKSYRDGLVIRERLARSDPDNADWQRDLSVSYNRIGDVLKAQGNLPEALKSFRNGLAIAERLARGDPSNALWQRGLWVSWNKIGDVLKAQGDLPEALKSYRDGLAIAERLARGDPGNAGWQRDLSVSWNLIGDVLKAQGNLLEALKSYRDGLAIAERLARGDPSNADWQRDLSVSYDRIANVLNAQGNLPEALKSYRNGLAIAERLARGDPGNAGWQRDLSLLWTKIGSVLKAQGNLPEALKSYRDGLAIAERLARGDPGNADWQRDLFVSQSEIAETSLASGNVVEALVAVKKAYAIAKDRTTRYHGEMNTDRELDYVLNLLNRCQQGTTRPITPQVRADTSVHPANSTQDVVSEGRAALVEGKNARALDLLRREGDGSPACRELIGVCLMRLGKARETLDTLNEVLFPRGETTIPDSTSPRLIANYATAQLLTGDIRGAKNTLAQVWDTDQPVISRLLAAIFKWEQSLSFTERTKWRFGGTPPKPIHLDPPYGEL